MKSIKNLIMRSLSVVAPMAIALAVMTANSTCYFFSHQPEQPTSLKAYAAQRKMK